MSIVLVTMSQIGLQPDAGPPTVLELEEICDFPTPIHGCFADVSHLLHAYAGEPSLDAWILLDENMVVRAFEKDTRTTAPPEGMKDFEEFERTLATMLDYTPPTYP